MSIAFLVLIVWQCQKASHPTAFFGRSGSNWCGKKCQKYEFLYHFCTYVGVPNMFLDQFFKGNKLQQPKFSYLKWFRSYEANMVQLWPKVIFLPNLHASGQTGNIIEIVSSVEEDNQFRFCTSGLVPSGRTNVGQNWNVNTFTNTGLGYARLAMAHSAKSDLLESNWTPTGLWTWVLYSNWISIGVQLNSNWTYTGLQLYLPLPDIYKHVPVGLQLDSS